MRADAQDWTELSRAYYAAVADAYAENWADVLLPANRQLLALLPLAGARTVLDIGAGTGALLPDLRTAASHARIVLADWAASMLAKAEPAADRVVADAGVLPFARGCFDVAVSTFMLQHIADPGGFLREVRDVLVPGGTVGLATWGDKYVLPAVEEINAVMDGLGLPPAPVNACMGLTDTPGKLAELLATAGFGQISTRRLHWQDAPGFERYWRRATHMGVLKRRADLVPADERPAVLRQVRSRLAELAADAFTDHTEVLGTVAVRA